MNRSRILVPVFVCVIAVVAMAAAPPSHLPTANTRAAVMAYVKDAATVVQKNGPSCDAFAKPEWRSADYYVFVSGPDNKLICHANASVIGKSAADVVNKNGDMVGAKITKMGMADGQGWLDYLWTPTGKTTEETKSTYVMGITGPDHKHYVVGAGGFGLAK
jgi:hypothetical protein